MKLPIVTKKYFKEGKLIAGFTMIEIIVVLAVFLFVVGATVSIFVSIVQSQKRVLSEQEVLNQTGYVEEYMSKALRSAKVAVDDSCVPVGYIYLLTHYDSGPGVYKGIEFINADAEGNPVCQEFFLGNCDHNNPSSSVLCEIKGGGLATPLTSVNLQFDTVNPIRFSIEGSNGSTAPYTCPNPPQQCGASETDLVQPRVTILLNAKISGDAKAPLRAIQTTVSQRNFNAK